MGLWGTQTQWRIAQRLPDLPRKGVAAAGFESLAIAQRADLPAERAEIAALARKIARPGSHLSGRSRGHIFSFCI
jgi:hypothetical protein